MMPLVFGRKAVSSFRLINNFETEVLDIWGADSTEGDVLISHEMNKKLVQLVKLQELTTPGMIAATPGLAEWMEN